MQLRYACAHTGAEYVLEQAWLQASLPRCPLHPQGGCGFARHGTYSRVSPPGTLVARWYCPTGRRTFSLLPDCLAARLTGTLAEVEAVVRAAEQAPSLEAACAALRLDIELPGALRWVGRRVRAVHASLHLLRGLLPERCGGCAATLAAFGERLGVAEVLVALRGIAEPWLRDLPKPLGFRPRRESGGGRRGARQHWVGADPPGAPA
ncbi:MAG: hypothetical protein LJE69_13515 [Thiohalocapsa sp.]|uniref:hypothetical protein n=1 Tax=Thiohalocapsa sp. TaxID=2497641 RepID=UPI0025EAF126|nr:hypothetical protein [Thiohalocapsa sp.]MCG6942256.1 hypothetical protein [Thiohalocapsa sp.]